jgi:uncharacterized membrane-anchored protein
VTPEPAADIATRIEEHENVLMSKLKALFGNGGEFVMNHMDLLIGWVDISDYDGVTSPDYLVFINTNPNRFESRYYRYIFRVLYHIGYLTCQNEI